MQNGIFVKVLVGRPFAELKWKEPKVIQSVKLRDFGRNRSTAGWQASESGRQTVRILFDRPQRIKKLYLAFQEFKSARTQEFVLRWSSDSGKSYRDIVRQQYNFSPPSTTAERQDYSMDLDGVTNLELANHSRHQRWSRPAKSGC